MRLGWDFLEHKAPDDPKAGLKIYLINSVFNGRTLLAMYWQYNPAMVYGLMVNSLIAWYPYSGDEQVEQDAFRSQNYAADYAASDVRVSRCGTDYGDDGYWWSDGYADYLRHINWVVGAQKEEPPAAIKLHRAKRGIQVACHRIQNA